MQIKIGNKAVNITRDGTGTYRAMLVQIYKGEEQVLEARDYGTLAGAERWAKKQLSY